MTKEDYSPEFLEFWKLYPTRWIRSSDRYVKIGREKAWLFWRQMSEKSRQWAMFAVHKEKISEFIPDAWRWLRDKKYKDYDYEMPEKPPTIAPDARTRPNPILATPFRKTDDMVTQDRIQEEVKKLNIGGKFKR